MIDVSQVCTSNYLQRDTAIKRQSFVICIASPHLRHPQTSDLPPTTPLSLSTRKLSLSHHYMYHSLYLITSRELATRIRQDRRPIPLTQPWGGIGSFLPYLERHLPSGIASSLGVFESKIEPLRDYLKRQCREGSSLGF